LTPDPGNPLPPLSQYDWSSGPISQIPSPVGAPIFSSYSRPIGGQDYIEFRLAPQALVTYAYNCQAGQCTGSAEDIWQAMPATQKESYLVAVLQAEQTNQSWEPRLFEAAVVSGDQQQGDPGRACAMVQVGDAAVGFAASCSGPFRDHLAQ
jgi:hypothetical protein